jgi:PST family polysaccharide transporter
MSFLPLSVFIDNVFGTQIMLNCNLKKHFMRIILSGGICSLVLLLVLVPRIGALGSAISFDISELVIMASMVFFVKKAGIRLLRTSKAINEPEAIAGKKDT